MPSARCTGENASPSCTRSFRIPVRDDRVHRRTLRLEPGGAGKVETASGGRNLRVARLLDFPFSPRSGAGGPACDRRSVPSIPLGYSGRIAARSGCREVAVPGARVRLRSRDERGGIPASAGKIYRPHPQGSAASRNGCRAVSLLAPARCFREGCRREL